MVWLISFVGVFPIVFGTGDIGIHGSLGASRWGRQLRGLFHVLSPYLICLSRSPPPHCFLALLLRLGGLAAGYFVWAASFYFMARFGSPGLSLVVRIHRSLFLGFDRSSSLMAKGGGGSGSFDWQLRL